MILPNWTTFRAYFATSSTTGPDGIEVWPVAKVHAASIPIRDTIPRPITAFPLTLTASSNTDATNGYTHTWYLSQRTDTPASQYFTLTQPDATKSGVVTMALTAKAVSDLGLSGVTATLNEDNLRALLNNVAVYVQRTSDDAIEWVDMLPFTLTEVNYDA